MTNKDQDQYIYLPMKNCVRTRYNFEKRCFEQKYQSSVGWEGETFMHDFETVPASDYLVEQLVSILFDRESDC